ncbi:hypothetical protein EOD42_22470 [Rhodovarius crocodyli]|uniref:Uncharacterized protein n=1 Tax=Rhodovarius crocodyli TaxID=1979269 RepID=A0A437M1K5_9PROT|nr:hypothetical protein [Rhodovarius crocodyli]RVT91423.1 hypothetical protein EOD42_22470 [Rhodovarius crocodyli]
MPKKTNAQHRKDLARLGPAARDADLGQAVLDLIASNNALRATVLALTAKLDTDAGVTDTNYTTTANATLPAVVADLASRS